MKKLNRIYDIPELVGIVKMCEHPSTAEEIAEKIEYPTSLLREVRYAGMLKRDFLNVFRETFDPITSIADALKGNRTRTKYFSCGWGIDNFSLFSESFELPGILAVTPHPFLPPLFWEYELAGSDTGQIIFSHKKGNLSSQGNISVLVTEGSHSIPVGLKLFTSGGSLFFKRTDRDDQTFLWQSDGRLAYKVSCDDSAFSNINRSVSFYPLSDAEKKLYGVSAGVVENIRKYHLVLREELQYPVEKNGSTFYSLETRYMPVMNWQTHDTNNQPLIAKKIALASPNWKLPETHSILIAVVHAPQTQAKPVRIIDNFTERVDKMYKGTPESIDFIKTIDRFFSFKRKAFTFSVFNDTNHAYCQPLVEVKK